jgi:DNA-binding GntR family transcriptional regulator
MDTANTGFETQSARVYGILRDEIIGGALKPGDRLVRRSISKRLGVSPIPVMEALFRLEQEGLVESQPMFGSRVTAITPEGLRNDQVLREALECEAARRCAGSASDAGLETLAEHAACLDELMASAEPNNRSGMEAHLDFHLEIARQAAVPVLEREIRRVWTRRLMRWNWLNAAAFSLPADWHARLVKAIATRDPEKAGKAMRDHVRQGQEHDDELLSNMSSEQNSLEGEE